MTDCVDHAFRHTAQRPSWARFAGTDPCNARPRDGSPQGRGRRSLPSDAARRPSKRSSGCRSLTPSSRRFAFFRGR
jgi:hypothetical protein